MDWVPFGHPSCFGSRLENQLEGCNKLCGVNWFLGFFIAKDNLGGLPASPGQGLRSNLS